GAQTGGRRRLEVECRPSHLVAGKIEFQAKSGQNVVADNPVNGGASQSDSIHPFKLKRRLNSRLRIKDDNAALQLESLNRCPAILARSNPQFLANIRSDK